MKNSIIIIDDALENTAQLDHIYKNIISDQSHVEEIIHKDNLKNHKSLFEKCVKRIISQLWEVRAKSLYEEACLNGFKFFEAWANSYTDPYNRNHVDRGGLPYHIDKDEKLYDYTGSIKTPTYASLIYLGPNSKINGGDLFINTEGLSHFIKFQENGTKEIDLTSSNWTKIKFKYNRFVIFDGSFPHLVSPVIAHPPNEPRAALAINLWDRELSC